MQLAKAIGMYSGFNAEMLSYDSVTEMEDDLRSGKVDALVDFLNTDKRQQGFIFKRYGDGPMIAMFDIDFFKGKNDAYGHEYGDFVLRKAVEVLRSTLRKSDEVIRWGGDEFIVLFPRTNADNADRILEKMVSAIGNADFTMADKGEKVTISVGAAFFQPDDEDITPVIRRCDSALYEAKALRNTFRLYDVGNEGNEGV